MKNYLTVTVFSLFVLLASSACNHSGGQQTFSSFVTQTFAVSAEEVPKDLDTINLIFDVEDDESVFDQIIIDGEFSV